MQQHAHAGAPQETTLAGDQQGGESGSPELDGHQRNMAEERSAVEAEVIHEAVRKSGEHELSRSTSALAWSGLAAGLSMGFSLVASGILRAHLPDEPWRILIDRLGYPVGFLLVVLGRQQLYTENTLTAVVPVLARRTLPALRNMLRLWGIVLLGNMAGAAAFAALVGLTYVFPPNDKQAFEALSVEAFSGRFGPAFLGGVFAGWLIALMAWLLPAVRNESQALVIFFCTYIIGIGSLPHVIAGSVEVLYGVVTGKIGAANYLAYYFVPVLLGNTAGGVSIVAVINHAQVMAGGEQANEA